MAVRFEAGASAPTVGRLQRTPAFTGTPYTVVAWFRFDDDSVGSTEAFDFYSTDFLVDDWLELRQPNLLRVGTYDSAVDSASDAWQDATWHCMAMTRSATTQTGYVLDRGVVLSRSTTYSAAFQVEALLGYDGDVSAAGRAVTHYKCWTAALTHDELAREMQQFAPVRTADLVAYAKLEAHTDLSDEIAGSFSAVNATPSTASGPGGVPDEWEGPTVASSATTAATSSSGGLSINLPSGVASGDLLMAFAANDTSVSWSASAGWEKLDDGANGSAVQGACWAKIAAGSDTLTITGEANDIAVVTIRIPAAQHGVTDVTTIVKGTAATGSSNAPNGPNCNPGTSGKYLWITYYAADDDDNTASWWPAEGAPVAQVKSATGSSSCQVGVAYRWLEASSYNPTTFLMAASEEWRAQTFAIPAAASGSTYDDTLTESVTAGQSFTNTAVFVSGVSESATAGDAYAAALTAPAALSESATLGDAFVGAAVQSATLTEDVEFGESMAVSAAFVASLSDAAILADAYAPAHTMPATISEPVTLADVYSPALTISVTLVESATLGDGATTGTIYNDTLGEAVSAADAYAAVLTISATVSESVAASDAYASVAVMAAAIIEAFTPADAFGAGAIFPTTIGESTTLGDSYPDEHNQSGSDSFTESVSLVDDYTAQAAFAAGLVESASMGDAFTAELVIPVALAESVSLADAYASARLVTADLDESVAMADAVASVLQAITTLAEDVALDDSMLGTVAGTLTVDLPHTRRVGPRVMSFGVTRIGARRMSFGSARIGPRRMQFGVRRIGPRTIKGD